tara:strand:- start:1363 stop:1557 length:195 start_codon:yes stop_codon:yes gene_type:complete
MTKGYITGYQMINKVYLKYKINKIMPYNETKVVIGGLMHIPVIIFVLRFIENRFQRNANKYLRN